MLSPWHVLRTPETEEEKKFEGNWVANFEALLKRQFASDIQAALNGRTPGANQCTEVRNF